MEKKRFCHYGLYAFVLLAGLIPFNFLYSQTKEVEVSVEVQIEGDNVASAVEKAQYEAFRKAVAQTLDSGLSEEQRSRRIREASQYIKSFRMVDQKEEAGKLIAKFRCEVLTAISSEYEGESGYEENYAFEFTWRGDVKKPSLTQLRNMLVDEYKLKIELMKLQSGNWWVEVRTAKNPNSVLANLSSRLGPNVNVRLVKDLKGIFSNQSNGSP